MLSGAVDRTEIDPTLSWAAVYTRHQHEKIVAQTLTAKGFEVFLPLYESVRRWKDRRKLLSLPLFPGYVFVRGAIERRLHVVTTPGIHMILCHGDKVAIIPEEEILTIQKAVNSNFQMQPHPFLKCGESVRVIRGALSGIEGILVRRKMCFAWCFLSICFASRSDGGRCSGRRAAGQSRVGWPATRASAGKPPVSRPHDFVSWKRLEFDNAAPEIPARAV